MTPSPDDPITLADACETIFGGKIRPATLRAEAGRGNLIVFRIGRRDFTTAHHVREMMLKCRVANRPPDLPSIPSGEHGLSATDRITSAQAALKQMLQERNGRSKPISVPNTNRSGERTR